MWNKILNVGQTLSEMVMPNIGAFITWGFLTAIFICPYGWFPNEFLSLISPFMLNFLIPILIAGQGGKITGGARGRVVASIAICGCIAANYSVYQQNLIDIGVSDAFNNAGIQSDTVKQANLIPMLLPAMIIGPLSGFIIKKFDHFVNGKTHGNLSILVDNFSIGLIGMALAILFYVAIGPVIDPFLYFFETCVRFLVDNALLPLVAIIIEPAKVLFLNNALNLGIFTPLGEAEVEHVGKSILFMLETNPGPGLGMLLAIWAFSENKIAKESAPGAVIIHAFGGIHEIYFPYVLAAPLLILAPIIGNMFSISIFMMLDTGCVGVPSPGSIIMFLMMAEPTDFWEAVLGIAVSTIVSFAVSWPIIKGYNKKIKESNKAKLIISNNARKSKLPTNSNLVQVIDKDPALVTNIVFACTVGIGFSVMGATIFGKRLKEKRPDIIINNFSVNNIPNNADIVVCESALIDQAKASTNGNCQFVKIENFLEDPELDNLFNKLTSVSEKEARMKKETSSIKLTSEDVVLGLESVTKDEAIQMAGEKLKELGACTDEYIQSMHDREKEISTYIGMGVAIPHGIIKDNKSVIESRIVLLQFPDGVNFYGEKAYLIFGIAGVGSNYIDLLAKISDRLQDEEIIAKLATTSDKGFVLKTLN